MTTITKEEVRAFIEQIESDLANGWEAQIFELKLARIALTSLNATPIYQVQYGQQWRDVGKEGCGDHRDHGSSTRIVYAEPPAPVTGIYDDVLNIIGLLKNNEWAEHCTSTDLGSLLESEITRLVSKEPPAPLSDAEREELNRLRIATCDHGLGGAHTQGVIGCERCAGRMVYAWGGGGCEMIKPCYRSPREAIWDIRAWAGQADFAVPEDRLREIERYLEIAAGTELKMNIPEGIPVDGEGDSPEMRAYNTGYALGWNDCLSEVLRGNKSR
ncbi:hypothetical protein ACV2F4_07875 [Salmonella enterica subsp. houtenae serovar 6,7:z4,z24:-]